MATRTFIVWNEAKTEGFATTDHQLAYEVRKGSVGNCHHEDGTLSHLAVEFCGLTENENYSIEEVEESVILEDGPRAL